MQEATTFSIFYDGISFQNLATVLISVVMLCYGLGILFRGPPYTKSVNVMYLCKILQYSNFMLHACWDVPFVLASMHDFINRLYRYVVHHMQTAIALLVGPIQNNV